MTELPLEYTEKFLGAEDNWQKSQNVILGVPLDITTTFRPGTRFGPREIRFLSHSLELYSPFQERSLERIDFADAGDLMLPAGDLQGSLNRIERMVDVFLSDSHRPFILGGEHLLTWPAVKACLKYYPDLVILVWDAHGDMRKDKDGYSLNHGTVMNLIREAVGGERMYLMGVRSECETGMERARETNIFLQDVLEPMKRVREEIMGKPVYFSLDIDVVDPAFAPGTGAPEPAGITSRELMSALALLEDLNIVGADLVEVAPAYDPSQITALLAARSMRELLLMQG